MVYGRIQQPTTVNQQQLCSFYFIIFLSQYVNERLAPSSSPEGGEPIALCSSPSGKLGGA